MSQILESSQGPIVGAISTMIPVAFPPAIYRCKYCGQYGVDQLKIHYRRKHADIRADKIERKRAERSRTNSSENSTSNYGDSSRFALASSFQVNCSDERIPEVVDRTIPKLQRQKKYKRSEPVVQQVNPESRHLEQPDVSLSTTTTLLEDKDKVSLHLPVFEPRPQTKSANLEPQTDLKFPAELGFDANSPPCGIKPDLKFKLHKSTLPVIKVEPQTCDKSQQAFWDCIPEVDLSSTVKLELPPYGEARGRKNSASSSSSVVSTSSTQYVRYVNVKSEIFGEIECPKDKVIVKLEPDYYTQFSDKSPEYLNFPEDTDTDTLLREKYLARLAEQKLGFIKREEPMVDSSPDPSQESCKRVKKLLLMRCRLKGCNLWVSSRPGKRRSLEMLIDHISSHVNDAELELLKGQNARLVARLEEKLRQEYI